MTDELDLSNPDAVLQRAGELAGSVARGDVDTTDAPSLALASIALSLLAGGLREQAAAKTFIDGIVNVQPYPKLTPFDPLLTPFDSLLAPLGSVVARPDPTDLRRWIRIRNEGDDHLDRTWLLVSPEAPMIDKSFDVSTWELPTDVVVLGPPA